MANFRFSPLTAALFVLVLAALPACSTTGPQLVTQEEFLSSTAFTQSFPGTERQICEAARRALLSQGYVIGTANNSIVNGRKNFQPEMDAHWEIEFHVTCAPNSQGSNSTTLFANAVRDSYTLRKSSNSASLGVSALGSISLPFSSSYDALVKVSSETIPNKRFYKQFFDLVERYLDPAAVDSAIGVGPEADMDAQSGND
jgi:hypothetical protein